jgi:hypothetical protein
MIRSIVRLAKLAYWGWMVFAMALGFVNTRILLTLFFYLVLTPIGLLLRLFGKDPLHLSLDSKAKTYWTPKTKEPYNPEHYKRQF